MCRFLLIVLYSLSLSVFATTSHNGLHSPLAEADQDLLELAYALQHAFWGRALDSKDEPIPLPEGRDPYELLIPETLAAEMAYRGFKDGIALTCGEIDRPTILRRHQKFSSAGNFSHVQRAFVFWLLGGTTGYAVRALNGACPQNE